MATPKSRYLQESDYLNHVFEDDCLDVMEHLPDNSGQVIQFNAPLSIKAHSPVVYNTFIQRLV